MTMSSYLNVKYHNVTRDDNKVSIVVQVLLYHDKNGEIAKNQWLLIPKCLNSKLLIRKDLEYDKLKIHVTNVLVSSHRIHRHTTVGTWPQVRVTKAYISLAADQKCLRAGEEITK